MVPAIFDSAFPFWDIGLISSPNTGCLFLMSLTAFGWEKISTQKIRIFFPKFYSLKAHAHYFTLFIYLHLEELLNLIFLLILLSQTYRDIAKTWTLEYLYTLCRSPAAFYKCLITVVITLLRTTTAQKKFSVLHLDIAFLFPLKLVLKKENPS